MKQEEIDKTRISSPRTDTETGQEHLPPEEDREKSLQALEMMYKRGLINEQEFKQRHAEIVGS